MTGQDLKEFRKELKLSQTKFAEKVGFSMRTIQDWEAMTELPKYATKLIQAMARNYSEFNPVNNIVVESTKEYNRKDKLVPYYESDVTGSITGSFTDIKEDPAFYVDFKPFNDCVAYFPIYGDSMYPRFASGEIIAVKDVPNKNTILWGEAYLVITDESENNLKTVKTIHPYDKDDSCIVLRASNPNYKGDTIIKKRAILNLYLVKGKIRKDQI